MLPAAQRARGAADVSPGNCGSLGEPARLLEGRRAEPDPHPGAGAGAAACQCQQHRSEHGPDAVQPGVAPSSGRALARLAGVPHSTVARIELGRLSPRTETLERLLRAAGQTLSTDSTLLAAAWIAARSANSCA